MYVWMHPGVGSSTDLILSGLFHEIQYLNTTHVHTYIYTN